MTSPKELLNNSVQSFQDGVNEVKLCPYTRTEVSQGYNFISINRRKTKKIIASIELDVDWRRTDLGYLKNVNASVYTQEKITGNYCILYQDAVIFINDFSGYTEKMGQYLYKGQAVTLDKLPLIDNGVSNKEIYGYSSLDLLMSFSDEVYRMVPEYLPISLEDSQEGIFLVKIEETEAIDMLRTLKNKKFQTLLDTVTIKVLNKSRKDLIDFITDLINYSQTEELFGLVENYQISEENVYDDFSNLRGIQYQIKLKISYNIFTIQECEEKKISQVMFRIKNAGETNQ